jgi:hypothetical protein
LKINNALIFKILENGVLAVGDAACAITPSMVVSEITWVTLTILQRRTTTCLRREDEEGLKTGSEYGGESID